MKSLIIADYHLYHSLLRQVQQESGGHVCVCSVSDVLPLLRQQEFDAVVVEPAGPTEESVQRAINECKSIVESDWGQSHRLTIYTSIPKKDIRWRISQAGIEPRAVDVFSKTELEIPPALQSIARHILQDPGLIGIDMSGTAPPEVSEEWIRSANAVYVRLCDYLVETAIQAGMREMDPRLPASLRDLDSICTVESEVGNGGFYQFFGNRTCGEGSDATVEDEVQQTIKAARRLGLEDMAALVERGLEKWQHFLDESQGESEIDSHLAVFDEAFYYEQHKWTDRLETFIKSHPDQFIHRAPWLSHDSN